MLAGALAGCTLFADLDELAAGSASGAGGGGLVGIGGDAAGSGGAGNGPAATGTGGGTSCPSGMADCDGDQVCEATLATDHDHCGMCDRNCGEGDCVAGTCPPLMLAAGLGGPSDIAYQDGVAYWVNYVTGALLRCQVTGCNGAPTQLGVSGYWSFYIALDATDVYWNNNGAGSEPGSIWRCPLDGGCANDQPWIAPVSNPTQVGVDASHVYWHSNDGNVERAPKTGGKIETIVVGAGNSGDVQPHGGQLFWTDAAANSVRGCQLVDRGCGAEIMDVSGAWQNPGQLLVDETHVYFATFAGNDADVIARVERSSGALETLLSTSSSIQGIAMNETHLYFSEGASGTVQRIPKAGGSVQVVASAFGAPGRLAVGDGFVFVVVGGETNGQIWRFSW